MHGQRRLGSEGDPEPRPGFTACWLQELGTRFQRGEGGWNHSSSTPCPPPTLLTGTRLEMAVCKSEGNRCSQHARVLFGDTPMLSLHHCDHQGCLAGRGEVLS